MVKFNMYLNHYTSTINMVTFVATALDEKYESYQFISSLILQSDSRWKCIIYCDEPNDYIRKCVEFFNDDRITIIENKVRTGNWGHLNRKVALEKLVNTKFIIQTSIQDYYTPNTVFEILSVPDEYDFIYYNSLHNHYQHAVLYTVPIVDKIDWGCFAIKTDIAKQVGINHVNSDRCDGLFVQDCFKIPNLSSYKINKILTVHN